MAEAINLARALLDGDDGQESILTFAAFADDGSTVLEATELPFYPETVEFSHAANWAQRDAIGGSRSYRQWVSTSSRTVSLTLRLARDIRPVDTLPATARLAGIDPRSVGLRRYNVDIDRMVRIWSSFLMPSYSGEAGEEIARPPPRLLIRAPGLGWSHTPKAPDDLWCTLTSMSVRYMRAFQDGTPRLVELDLALAEEVQGHGAPLKFFGREDLLNEASDPDAG